MKVHEHSSTSVINWEALELQTKRNLKLQLVNSTSSEPRPPPFWIRVITPCCGQWYKHRARGRLPPNWKIWQHPVLDVYYFHISWYVCEPYRAPLNVFTACTVCSRIVQDLNVFTACTVCSRIVQDLNVFTACTVCSRIVQELNVFTVLLLLYFPLQQEEG